MSRVIQVRDVPEPVHAALQAAARSKGQSLTRYLLDELERLAARPAVAQHNAAVVAQTRSAVGGRLETATVLDLVAEGRDR